MPTPSRASFIITNMALQAAVLLADQPAGGAVVVHHAGRVAVDAHLLFDRAAGDAVARAERAVGVDHELRHDEQRDALGAGRRAFDARQHQVDDVLRQVVLAGGDEDLGAGDLVAAVGLLARPWCAAGRGRCRNAARSGSWCRSSSPATIFGRYVAFCSGEPCASSAAMAPCVRPGYMAKAMLAEQRNSLTIDGQRRRQALAAEFRRRRNADPAAFDDLLEGVLEAGRRGDAAVGDGACSLPCRRPG